MGAVGNYVNTMESAVTIVMGHLDDAEEPRDAFLGAFLTARPEVAAITAYDADGALLNCWAQDGRTPKAEILRNLSFNLTTARRLSQGYISTPHVESIFAGYYPWVVSIVRTVPGTAEKRWLSLDLSFTELAATISNVGIGQHGYCYLMDERGNMVYHPQQQLLYAGLKKEEAVWPALVTAPMWRIPSSTVSSACRTAHGALSASATLMRPSTKASGRWCASPWQRQR